MTAAAVRMLAGAVVAVVAVALVELSSPVIHVGK